MEIKLEQVDIKEKGILGELIKDYQKEILKTNYVGEYKYLDIYWQKPDRHPYFIKVEGKIAGFVLINKYSLIEKSAYSVAEFYIKKEFRNNGIGKLAAFMAFDLHPGKWEIREMESNPQAHLFWNKTVGEYTKGDFKELVLNNEEWRGTIQIFET